MIVEEGFIEHSTLGKIGCYSPSESDAPQKAQVVPRTTVTHVNSTSE